MSSLYDVFICLVFYLFSRSIFYYGFFCLKLIAIFTKEINQLLHPLTLSNNDNI